MAQPGPERGEMTGTPPAAGRMGPAAPRLQAVLPPVEAVARPAPLLLGPVQRQLAPNLQPAAPVQRAGAPFIRLAAPVNPVIGNVVVPPIGVQARDDIQAGLMGPPATKSDISFKIWP